MKKKNKKILFDFPFIIGIIIIIVLVLIANGLFKWDVGLSLSENQSRFLLIGLLLICSIPRWKDYFRARRINKKNEQKRVNEKVFFAWVMLLVCPAGFWGLGFMPIHFYILLPIFFVGSIYGIIGVCFFGKVFQRR